MPHLIVLSLVGAPPATRQAVTSSATEQPLSALPGILPWFLPGLAITTVIALAIAGRVARRLRTERWIAVLLVMSVGAVLAATIPPISGGLDYHPPPPGQCDFSRIGPAALSQYLQIDDPSLNVILFVPLGLAIGLLGRSPAAARLFVPALALSPAVEATQSLVPILGRGCESADVVDNLLGLGIGLAVGVLLSVVRAGRTRRARARGRPREPDPPERQPRQR
jgi:VanZ family protein